MQASTNIEHLDVPTQPPRVGRGTRKRAVLVGTGAFLLFGSWALFANRAYPVPAMTRAGLAQGALSFVSTTFSVLLLEYLYRLGRTPARKFLFAAVGTPAVVLLTMTGVHVLAGTPNLVATLLPSCISGFIFCGTYTLALRRGSTRASNP